MTFKAALKAIMYLDSQLAQQIVDRTMTIINSNINVMNERGIIIASGDRERVGHLHDGALLAIQHGDTIEISEQNTQDLNGVKSGINLLLYYKKEIIGVVGITGDPEKIRDYALLVKMTAEMIIERSALLEQLQWDKRHIEEFISAWVNHQLDQQALHDWANRLDIDLSIPRVAVLIEVDTSSSNLLPDVKQVFGILKNQLHSDLITIIGINQILALCPINKTSIHHTDIECQNDEKKLLEQTLKRFCELIKYHRLHHTHLAIGQYFPKIEEIPLSFESAKLVMAQGKQTLPQQRQYVFSELRLPVLLSPLRENKQSAQLTKTILRLKEQDKSGQLFKTLQQLFEQQGNLKACAENLFIHRNTLRYRLDKIEKITGISPHSFTGLVELYIGLVMLGQ